ncbi:MAG: hypothetical protein JWQ04_2649 [Pedosphaera sp.]|nr:hypothetical protein [Pedosphaera sp.]
MRAMVRHGRSLNELGVSPMGADLFGTGFAGHFAAKIYGELSNRRALLLPRPVRNERGEGRGEGLLG